MTWRIVPFVFLVLVCRPSAAQFPLNNGVVDQPDIECQPHGVGVKFRTLNPFNGHVFVRGHYNEENCHKDYVLNDVNGGLLDLQFEKCGMRRKRSANPRGMSMSATVVVSFHRTFITSVDRAYHIECFYMEADKVLTQSIGVSMLTPAVLGQDPQPMPDCQYRVLASSQNGAVVNFAKVGDRVFHEWNCVYPLQNMYCMMIHSCTVDDGAAAIYEVIDKDGCPRDTTILNQLKYTSDLRAGTEAMVFKFADKTRVYFTCQVRLSLRVEDNGGVCPRPSCGAPPVGRRKRRSRPPGGQDFDLSAQPLIIVEEEEGVAAGAEWRRLGSELAEVGVCLSESAFSIVLGVVVLVAAAAALAAVLFCLKFKAWKP